MKEESTYQKIHKAWKGIKLDIKKRVNTCEESVEGQDSSWKIK